ncbi:MAG: lycopene cyclase family protein [Thermaurantimonas sp.]|uniref:lycopene cyclase family protein n=1 Tax=Thermaurantimonas sp. TaxID=2681568 RepID=UPI0039195C52
METFDYIIAGAGASGLSMAYYMAIDPFFDDKKILLIDREPKTSYDRTWCFWTENERIFPDVVCKTWKKIQIKTPKKNNIFDIYPFSYHLIKSNDFYAYVLNILKSKKNFKILYESIEEIRGHGTVVTEKSLYRSGYVFSSIGNAIRYKEGNITLLQHFKGWQIETEESIFDANVATLMDFSIEQYKDCRFCYVLPYSEKEAMVEYTIFSDKILKDEEYEYFLEEYIKKVFGNIKYTINHKEFGVIPMSDIAYTSDITSSVINIGTVGGATKASTGYTFYFIQKQAHFYIQQLKKGKIQKLYQPRYKYRLYDSVLLRVIQEKQMPAYKIFEDLFFKLKIQEVFNFLNEKSSLLQDIKIMSSVNIPVFLRAMISQIRKI